MIDHQGLESALSRTEADAGAAVKTSLALVAQLKRVQKAAEVGAVGELDKALSQADQLALAARDAVLTAREGWRFDTRSHLEAGHYTREIVSLAHERGVLLQEQDGRIVSYPSVVRVLPGEDAIEIDRKKRKELRPSRLIEMLQAARERPPRFRPERFLAALLRAYRLVTAEKRKEVGEAVRLVDVYRVLTVLPGQSAAYSPQEFVRDVYLLDESGVEVTKEGLRMSLPAASGARTSSALRTITREGEVKVYYAIAFRP